MLSLLFHSQSFAQLIVEKSASQVSLSSIEQQFVQKITQLVDTKSAKYISIGDIASYASDGLVTFTLPGLGTISSEAVHVEYQNPNDYIWSGKFTNQPGYFSIIAKPQGKVGFFQTSTRYFSIQPVNSEVSLLKEVDLSLLPAADCWRPEGVSEEINYCEPDENDCFAEIDLLILITPDVQTWFGEQTDPWQTFLTVIQGIEGINLAFANSGIANKQIRWRAEMFDFDGFDTPLSIDDDIPEFAADAASLRAQRKADIVIMLTSMDYPSIAGAAQSGCPSYNSAFAIVEVQSIADPRWTFAHEFAHLLGANHNRPDNCSNADVCGDSNTDNCAHGWLFDDQNGNEQRTILARMVTSEVAARIPHYSNPDINFNGTSTGTEVNDNSRIIRNAACIVDDYNRAEWNVGIQGPPKWCINIDPVITFNAVVTPPNPGWGLLGNPPYQYEWRTSCSPTYNPSTFLSNQSSISLNTPLCEPSFWLQLTVTSADGLTRTSGRRIGIIEECPHFQGEEEDRGLKNNLLQTLGMIYPNPTKDKFILIAPFEGNCTEIILSDNFGRLVKHIKSCESRSIEVSAETLPDGIYFVSVRNESKIEAYKLIIQN